MHCKHTLLPLVGGRLQDYTKHQVEESWSLLSNSLLHWLPRTPTACCPRNANMKSSFHKSTRWTRDSFWTLKIQVGGLELVRRSEIQGLPSKCWGWAIFLNVKSPGLVLDSIENLELSRRKRSLSSHPMNGNYRLLRSYWVDIYHTESPSIACPA